MLGGLRVIMTNMGLTRWYVPLARLIKSESPALPMAKWRDYTGIVFLWYNQFDRVHLLPP